VGSGYVTIRHDNLIRRCISSLYRDTHDWQRAVTFSLLGLLVASTIIFTVVTLYNESCLCDAWKQWDRKGHPTNTSTVPREVAPSALPTSHDVDVRTKEMKKEDAHVEQ
jgi:hypothetical protein